MRQPELAARDVVLLSLLARGCVLRVDQVQVVYGTQKYHYKRLAVLEKRGYVLRRGRYVQIGKKGMAALGLNSRPLDVRRDWQRECRARVADVCFALKNWEFWFALEYKRRVEARGNARFDAVISRGGMSYALYLLNKNVRRATLSALRRDWASLRGWKLNGVVVLCPSPETLRAVETLPCDGVPSLLALPYPFGVEILNSLDRMEAEVERLFPDFRPCARPFADLEKGDVFVTVLVANDLVKRRLLQDYLTHVRAGEGKENVVVCLESQEPRFRQVLPGVEFVVLPDSVIVDRFRCVYYPPARGSNR